MAHATAAFVSASPPAFTTASSPSSNEEVCQYAHRATDNVTKVCEALNIIFSGVKNKRVSRDTNADGTIAKGDLIDSFSKPYTTIAGVIKTAMDDAIESSVRENNKQYYSHVNPCYLGKLIKQLKNFNNFLCTLGSSFFKNGRTVFLYLFLV